MSKRKASSDADPAGTGAAKKTLAPVADTKGGEVNAKCHEAAVAAAFKVRPLPQATLPPLPPLLLPQAADVSAPMPSQTGPHAPRAVAAAAATAALVGTIDELVSNPPALGCTNPVCEKRRFAFCPRTGNLCIDAVLSFPRGNFNCDMQLRHVDLTLRSLLELSAGELWYEVEASGVSAVVLNPKRGRQAYVVKSIDAICGVCRKTSGKFPQVSAAILDKPVSAFCSRVTSDLTIHLIKL